MPFLILLALLAPLVVVTLWAFYGPAKRSSR